MFSWEDVQLDSKTRKTNFEELNARGQHFPPKHTK